MTKKIKNAPGWLGLSTDRTFFIYLPDRAEIVRQIFQLSISGFGGKAIANLLNKKEVPAFGSSKKWDQSTIHNMLTSRATIGEYQRKQAIDGKEEPVGDPVPNYYPSVIDAATFESAQLARHKNLAARSGRRGKFITNLFFGLAASCSYCAENMLFYSKGMGNSLVCGAVMPGRGECHRFAWTYNDFENTFLESVESAGRYSDFSEILVQLRTGVQKKRTSNT
jgi:Recombinase